MQVSKLFKCRWEHDYEKHPIYDSAETTKRDYLLAFDTWRLYLMSQLVDLERSKANDYDTVVLSKKGTAQVLSPGGDGELLYGDLLPWFQFDYEKHIPTLTRKFNGFPDMLGRIVFNVGGSHRMNDKARSDLDTLGLDARPMGATYKNYKVREWGVAVEDAQLFSDYVTSARLSSIRNKEAKQAYFAWKPTQKVDAPPEEVQHTSTKEQHIVLPLSFFMERFGRPYKNLWKHSGKTDDFIKWGSEKIPAYVEYDVVPISDTLIIRTHAYYLIKFLETQLKIYNKTGKVWE